MGRKNRKRCNFRKEIEEYLKGKMLFNDSTEHARVPGALPYGSHYPTPRTKRSWKDICSILWETVQKYEDEQKELKKIYSEHALRIMHLDGIESVQVGDHNSVQVVQNFDTAALKDFLERIEDRLKNDARGRKSLEDQIQTLSSQIKELTNLHHGSEHVLHSRVLSDYFKDLHQFDAPGLVCPVSSIAKMSQQATDLINTFTCESKRLQDGIKRLSSCIDDPKMEILKSLSSAEISLSTVSLDERLLSRPADIHISPRNVLSEPNLHLHV